jgi:hypothetical protein
MLLMVVLVCCVVTIVVGSSHSWCCLWFVVLIVLFVCHVTGVVVASHCLVLLLVHHVVVNTISASHCHFYIGSLCCWCCSWYIMLLWVHCIVNVVGVVANVLHCCTPFATKYTPSPFPPLLLVLFLICQVVCAIIGALCYASGGIPL